MNQKLFKLAVMVLIAVFTIGTVGADLAYAKGGGGGSSFGGGSRSSSSSSFGGGSRSSSSSSFGGGSRSSSSASKSSSGIFGGGNKSKSQASTVPKASTSTKTTAPAQKTQTALQAKQSQAAKKAESAKAFDSYKAEKSKFKAPTSTKASAPTTEKAVIGKFNGGNANMTKNVYVQQRDNYRNSRGWSNPPTYVYNYPSSFGMWDGLFLWMMLDSISDNSRHDSEMYYHHQNDPAMQEWRANAEKEAATNAEMKAKLAALDQKVKEMEAQGVVRDESFVPTDAGAAVLAAEVAETSLLDETVVTEEPAAPAPADEESSSLMFVGILCALIFGGIVFFILSSKL